MKHKILHDLLTVQFGTVINLYSPTAKSYEGSLLKVTREVKKYLKSGLIQQIPFDLKPRNKRQQFFYYVTREGAKAIDRLEDYKQKITKSLNNAEHESMKIDVALSFIRNFPDYEFEFDYAANFDKLRPDIFITAKNIHDNRQYTFLVEIERKKEMTRTYRDKVEKYITQINDGFFKKNGLSPKTKILFFCSNLRYDPYLRPMQYHEHKNQLTTLYSQFNALISKSKPDCDNNLRFIPFPDFYRLNEAIAITPKKNKVLIIAN